MSGGMYVPAQRGFWPLLKSAERRFFEGWIDGWMDCMCSGDVVLAEMFVPQFRDAVLEKTFMCWVVSWIEVGCV